MWEFSQIQTLALAIHVYQKLQVTLYRAKLQPRLQTQPTESCQHILYSWNCQHIPYGWWSCQHIPYRGENNE